jgi:lia operon protein LiaG
MNKFKLWHLAVISVAVFLIFGIIAAVAIVTNNDLHDMNKWNFNWKDTNFGIILTPGKSYDIDEEKSESVNGISEIDISAIAADINVTVTDDDELTANLYGDYTSRNGELELIVQESGSKLKVYVKYPKNGISRTNISLDVQIPSSYSKDLSVDGVSSDIELETSKMDFEEVNIGTVSGKIRLNTINADIVKASSTSGDLYAEMINGELEFNGTSSKITVSGLSGEAKIDTVSGDVEFTMDKPNDAKVNTVSGKVTIKLEALEAFSVDFGTTSGNLECDFPLTLETNKRNSVKGYYDNDDSAVFDVNTTSGDLKIENRS